MSEHKFRILQRAAAGELCPSQAAELLNTSTTNLRRLETIWEAHLPTLVPLVDQLLQPSQTKHGQVKLKLRIKKHLGVTYREVNRLLKASEIVLPAPLSTEKRKIRVENTRKRRKTREKCALDVIFDLSDVVSAAEKAEISIRQMYRQCNRLAKLADFTYKELVQLPRISRQKVARQIEEELENAV
jgi:flagellar hook-basal body complex protein FliE